MPELWDYGKAIRTALHEFGPTTRASLSLSRGFICGIALHRTPPEAPATKMGAGEGGG